ncbi:hypothetical protein AB0L40_19985 [Patulibacter sp. NPDC049589]
MPGIAPSGYHLAFLVGAALMVLAALVTAVVVRGRDVAEIDPDQLVAVAA